MTREALLKRFPNASESFIRTNLGSNADGAPPRPKPEQAIRNESMAKEAREARYTGRIHVHIVSFRRRLCDPDNLCPKYFVDCLRYAGYIPNDREEDICLEVSQVKVKGLLNERTEITITPCP